MDLKLLLCAVILCRCHADTDDKKWVWSANNRDTNNNGRSYTTGLILRNPNTRYNVYEETDDYYPVNSNQYYGPLNNNHGPFAGFRPPISGSGYIPEERPGGVYGNSYGPTYASPHQYQYVPNDAPYKQFDKCKCTEKFNCNSPGVSYGHCDVGKKYCCYATKGEPTSGRPVHSIENGVLVGPGGPVDPIPGFTTGNKLYNRPQKPFISGGGFYRPSGGLSAGYAGPSEYSAADGILVGPGGPFDRPGFGIIGRTAMEARSAKD